MKKMTKQISRLEHFSFHHQFQHHHHIIINIALNIHYYTYV